MNILYKSASERGDLWADLLAKLAPDASFRQWPDIGDPASIDYLVAWQPPEEILQQFPNPSPEPLPQDHPFWTHPAIWLTPHIASQTQPESAGRALLENIRRFERGETMIGLVDRSRGY